MCTCRHAPQPALVSSPAPYAQFQRSAAALVLPNQKSHKSEKSAGAVVLPNKNLKSQNIQQKCSCAAKQKISKVSSLFNVVHKQSATQHTMLTACSSDF